MNGQKIPVIGSKVKVSIIPRAAVIQCWCSNPVESSLVGVMIQNLVAVPMAWLPKGDGI